MGGQIPGLQCKLHQPDYNEYNSKRRRICKVKAKFEISLTLLFTNFIYQKSSSGGKIRFKQNRFYKNNKIIASSIFPFIPLHFVLRHFTNPESEPKGKEKEISFGKCSK